MYVSLPHVKTTTRAANQTHNTARHSPGSRQLLFLVFGPPQALRLAGRATGLEAMVFILIFWVNDKSSKKAISHNTQSQGSIRK